MYTEFKNCEPDLKEAIKMSLVEATNITTTVKSSVGLSRFILARYAVYYTPKGIYSYLQTMGIRVDRKGESEFKLEMADKIQRKEKEEIAVKYTYTKIECARYQCDQVFVPKSINHKYCSPVCADKAKNDKRILDNLTEEPDPAVLRAATNELVREAYRQNGVLQRSLLKEQTRTSVILGQIQDYFEEHTEPRFSEYPARPMLKPGTGSPTDCHFIFSDPQGGKLENGVGLEVLLNDYMPKLTEKILRCVEVQRFEGPIDTFYLHLLGDLIENCMIFLGQRNTLDSYLNGNSSVDQVLVMADAISDIFVSRLRPNFKRFVVASAYGNHGRTGTKMDPSIPKDNLDRLVAEIVKRNCSNMDIEWLIPTEDRYCVNSLGFNIGAIHGHQLAGKSSLNSMELPILRWEAIHNFGAPLDVLLLGHRHHPASLDLNGIEVIQNGCIDGGSNYFTSSTGLWSAPSQELFFVSAEHGVGTRRRLNVTKKTARINR